MTCRQSEAIEAGMLESRVNRKSQKEEEGLRNKGNGKGEQRQEPLKKARDRDKFKDCMLFMHAW